MYEKNIWFPPQNILYHYDRYLKEDLDFLKRKDIKPIQEARYVSIMVVGMMENAGEDFWVQLVNPDEESPDARTLKVKDILPKYNNYEMQDIEVVTYNKHSTSVDLGNFIFESKLGKDKSYDNLTTILCCLETDIHVESWLKINKQLAKSHINSPVYILGRLSKTEHIYSLIKVHPNLEGPYEYNVMEILNKRGKRKVLDLARYNRKGYASKDILPF